jgi:hypothetical protein
MRLPRASIRRTGRTPADGVRTGLPQPALVRPLRLKGRAAVQTNSKSVQRLPGVGSFARLALALVCPSFRPPCVTAASGPSLSLRKVAGDVTRLLLVAAQVCPCGELCSNRSLHLLRQPKTEVFLTENRGWGVRAMEPLSKVRKAPSRSRSGPPASVLCVCRLSWRPCTEITVPKWVRKCVRMRPEQSVRGRFRGEGTVTT